jgi:hypothetical protein
MKDENIMSLRGGFLFFPIPSRMLLSGRSNLPLNGKTLSKSIHYLIGDCSPALAGGARVVSHYLYLARLQIAVFYCLYRGAKAACSVHGSPSGWHNKSVSTDFHELRRDFSPPNHVLQKRNLCPFSVYRSLLATT